jgi:Ca2+-binding RTX toxin-like protein
VIGRGGDDRLFGHGNSDILSGGAGNDRVEGGPGADQLIGGAGDDILNGGAGADTLLGRRGDDQLGGQAGNDLLSGGQGDDLLSGGLGRNTLAGGGGRDTFLFTRLDDLVDTVEDYRQGRDQLDLSPILPGFRAGDPLDDFVRLTPVDDDTMIAVSPDGQAGDFVDLVLVEGVQIETLSPADLGLPGGPAAAGAETLGEVVDDGFFSDLPGEQIAEVSAHSADQGGPGAAGARPDGGGGAAPAALGPALELASLVGMPGDSAV